jgi:FtsP/CotA-like multicopper oxidase with cupredoxin domain
VTKELTTSSGNAAGISLRIAPVKVEISPKQIVQTVCYNGSAPGPLLRVKEGQQVTVNVQNDSDVPELVHCHVQSCDRALRRSPSFTTVESPLSL